MSTKRHSDAKPSVKRTRSTTMIEIVKPPADLRSYRVVILPNGITTLLISEHSQVVPPDSTEAGTYDQDDFDDAEIDGEAAAALCVGVGSFSDLPDIPGLAHFLEHMVFMGSKKYPKENYWDAFLAKNGGDTNAWTDCERTCFFFTCSQANFQKALDIFAHFFISPLLRKDSVDKEIMAVDNECQMVSSRDSERMRSVLSYQIVEEGHPMKKFMAGNKKSLKEIPESKHLNVYEQLQAFCRRVYSAHYMTLVVHSTDQLDTMENYVMRTFNRIPNNGIPHPKFIKPPFKDVNFNKILRVAPVEDIHKMEIIWALPPLLEHYRARVIEFMSLLFGHEGRGSIMSVLKKRQLALQIAGGNDMSGYTHNSTWSAFIIVIKLTDYGLKNYEEVIAVVFQYIRLLNALMPSHVFREQQHIEEIKYIFQEQVSIFTYVEELAENMHMFPPEHYLCGRTLFLEYDEELIRHCLDFLKPECMLVVLYDKKFASFPGLKEEPWLGTKYMITDVDSAQISRFKALRLNPELHLPDPNPFIATNFSIMKARKATKYPIVVMNENGCRIWYKKDNTFFTPTAYVYFNFISSSISRTTQNMVLNDIYLTCLLHELTETLYHATLAGYEYSVEGAPEGIIFMIAGYSEKFNLVVEETLLTMHKLSIEKSNFNSVIAHLKQIYINDLMKPVEMARAVRYAALELKDPSLLERYEQIDSITYPMLKQFVEEFFNSLYIEAYVTGNLKPQDAVDIGQQALKMVRKPIKEDNFPAPIVLELPPGEHICHLPAINREDSNSCVVQYFQQGLGTFFNSCINEIIASAMSEPLFNVIRTQHQMGYSVYCAPVITHGVVGFMITVETQANRFSMQDVDQAVSDFLKNFDKTLASMPTAKVQDLIDAQTSLLQYEDADMQEESLRFWQEIVRHSYAFDRNSREYEAVKMIQHEDIIDWYRQTIENPNARQLTIMVEGCTKDRCDFSGTKSSTSSLPVNLLKDLLNCANKPPSKNEPLAQLQEGGVNYITNLCQFKRQLRRMPYHVIDS